MKAKIIRPDGTVLEFEGSDLELAAAIREALPPLQVGPTSVQFVPSVCTRPHADEQRTQPFWRYGSRPLPERSGSLWEKYAGATLPEWMTTICTNAQ